MTERAMRSYVPTNIEWADESWNPTTGCRKISEGCRHCYAEAIAKRLWKGRPFEDVQVHPERFEKPFRWRKPRRVFVNSMSDLFHAEVRDTTIATVLAVAALNPVHQFLVLTKRSSRMQDWMSDDSLIRLVELEKIRLAKAHGCSMNYEWPPRNVWLGVSVEDQSTAHIRVPTLMMTNAAVRFLSVEPLLGTVHLAHMFNTHTRQPPVDWVIVGGESGPGARPCDLHLMELVIQDCHVAGVPVFVKQLGRRPFLYSHPFKVKSPKGSDMAEWPESVRYRDQPIVRN